MGKVIRYDTVTKLGWSVDSRTHGIVNVIEALLAKDYDWSDEEKQDGEEKQKLAVPLMIEETDCVVSVTFTG